MLATIQRFTQVLNQYASLLLVFITIVYVGVTWQTLRALRQASLREREARHLQEIKEQVIEPIVSWISGTVLGRFAGISPALLTVVGGYGGKPRQISHTVDDPFRAMRHLVTFADPPDAPDPLLGWTSLEHGRIPKSLYDHAKQDHFRRELRKFDGLLQDVEQLTGTLVVFANECASDIAGREVRVARSGEDENSMSEWVNPYLLAVECTEAVLLGKNDPGIEVQRSQNSYTLTAQNRTVARSNEEDKLKQWWELGLKQVRERWEGSDLLERVKDLLRNADSIRGEIAYLLFTHSLGVDCDLVSGKERRMTKLW